MNNQSPWQVANLSKRLGINLCRPDRRAHLHMYMAEYNSRPSIQSPLFSLPLPCRLTAKTRILLSRFSCEVGGREGVKSRVQTLFTRTLLDVGTAELKQSLQAVWEDVDLFPMGKKEGAKDGENLHTIHILRNDVFIRGLIVLAPLGIAAL